MIKGHAKIELTNVKTGEKHVVEDNNMVTNAVKYWLTYSLTGPKRYTSPEIDNFFGGILLYEKKITENADNVNFPIGNKMVGNGFVGTFSNTAPSECGAFNFDESIKTFSNGKITRKYVYDFSTSKANGTISSVCLTNSNVGKTGTGNENSKKRIKSTNTVLPVNGNTVVTGGYNKFDEFKTDSSPKFLLFANHEKNFTALTNEISLSNENIAIYKVHTPFTSINPTLDIDTINVYEKVFLKIPDEMKGKTYRGLYNDYDYLYIFSIEETSIYIWKISVDLTESQVIKISNNTNVNIVNSACSLVIVQNSLFGVSSDKGKILKINLNDENDFVVIDSPEKVDFLFSVDATNIFLQYSSASNGIIDALLDPITNTVKEINYCFGGYNVFPVAKCKHLLLSLKGYNRTIENSSSNIYSPNMYNNPFMLSTINNLPEPITKTEDMVMKITYTITSTIE